MATKALRPGGTAKLVSIPGSTKRPLPGAKSIGAAPRDERFEVTIRLRPRTPLPDTSKMLDPTGLQIPILSHDEFDCLHGADPKDFIKLRKFAKANNLSVVRESVSRRSVMVSGTVENFNKAFGVQLKTYQTPYRTYRGRVGPVNIPRELADIIEGVFGLDNRPIAKRRGRATRHASAPTDGAHPFNPDQIAQFYNFPPGTDGHGQTIGIIELGGGYRPEDLEAYFGKLGLPTPTVIPVSVDGATNSPSTADSDDGEVVLDIEVASAAAPGAKIVVYFSTNDRSSDGFLDAITKAVHDSESNPSVISISWGGAEDPSTSGFQKQFDQVLQEAALLGITVCVAAGDDGAADMGPKVWDGRPHVDFPASSPFALACGGTRLLSKGHAIAKETVWNQHKADLKDGPFGSFGAGGGGVSETFSLQSGVAMPGLVSTADGAKGGHLAI
jgi:kumamolisin